VTRPRVSRTTVALLALVLATLTGCGDGVQPRGEPSTSSEAPESALSEDSVVALARPSVLKVRTDPDSCKKLSEGTGFVVGQHRVLTNAHMVAGRDAFTVEVDGEALDARVVSFDPNVDVSILDVPGLSAPPLSLASNPAKAGDQALVMGYFGAGTFDVVPARIREQTTLNGPDIYHITDVTREVYTIATTDGRSLQGISGSPLIDMNGRVLGVMFGNQVQHPDVGFAIASHQIAPQIPGSGTSQPVATGACVS
jgi:S1-C subfamily serine protease